MTPDTKVRRPLTPRESPPPPVDPDRLRQLETEVLERIRNEDDMDETNNPAAPVVAPRIPGGVKKWAGIIAGVAGIALMVVPILPTLPAWVPLAVFAVAGVSAILSGAAMPAWFGGRPVLQGTAAATALATGGALAEMATNLDGFWQSAVLLLATLLLGAAGKSVDTAKKPPA